MIIDQLSNVRKLEIYGGLLANQTGGSGLGQRIMAALDYLQTTDLANAKPGTFEIDGKNVYAMVQHYNTKPKEQGVWEAHRKYIDVQYVAEGIELMGYMNLKHLNAGEYDVAKDFLLLQGQGNFLLMPAGTFVILTPEDAHIPGVAVDSPQPVKKVVVKVAVADGVS